MPFPAAAAGGPDPFASTPSAPPSTPPASSDPFSAGPAAPDPFAAAAAAAANSSPPGGGGATEDPFAPSGDRGALFGAVGLDASASAEAPDIGLPPPAATAAPPDTGTTGLSESGEGGLNWRVRLAGGEVLESMTTDEVKEKIRAGEIDDKVDVALGEGAFIPISEKKIFAPTLRITSGKLAPDRIHARGASVKQTSRAPLFIFLFIVLVAAAGVGIVVVEPEWLSGLSGSGASDSFVRQAALWRLQFPDVDGTSEEHLRKGRKLYLEDTALGYRLADEEFRKALLLDPENLDAIAAFVENLARLPGLQQRTMDIKTAHDGLTFAIERDPARHILFRARGALLMASGDIQGAQEALDEAQRLEQFDAETLLLMAESNVARDGATAAEYLKQAQKLDASLKRVDLLMGMARMEQGEYRAALDAFEARLKGDTDHVETLIAVAQLYIVIGEFGEAVKRLEHVVELDGENRKARLILGKVYYQLLDDLQNADLQLSVAAEGVDSEDDATEIGRELFTHLAHVRARRDHWDEAAQSAEQALKMDPAFAPAHYALGLIKAHEGDHATAQKHLGRVIQATQGSYLETPARIALADTKLTLGRFGEAVRDFEKAAENDPRHVRAYMGLAAAYAKLNDSPNMAMAIRRLIDLDPDINETRRYITAYPEDLRDLQIYLQAFRDFEGQPDDLPIVQASMAIVTYQLGDYRTSETHARLAIQDDPKNATALLYMGAAALRKKSHGRAVDFLTRAHDANRLHTVTKYMLGKANVAAGKTTTAYEILTELRENDPNFLPGLCALADIARERNKKDLARELYRAAFKADVDLISAKRGLFLLGN